MNKELIKKLEEKLDREMKRLNVLYEQERKTKQKINQLHVQLNEESRKK